MKKPGSRTDAATYTLAVPAVITSAVPRITIPFRRRPVQRTRKERLLEALYGLPVPPILVPVREQTGQVDYRADLASNLQAVKRGSVEMLGTLAETARTDLPPIVRDASERATEIAGELGTRGRVVAADISERFQADLAPAAKTLGKDALVSAEDVLDTVRERASELAATARKEYVPRFSAGTVKLSRVIVPTSAGTVETFTRRAKRTLGISKPSRPERVRQQVSSSVSGVVHQAGSQTKHVAGETTMIMAWGTALGLVVYYGVLTTDQRERLTGFISSAYEQAREAVRDFRSSESEF